MGCLLADDDVGDRSDRIVPVALHDSLGGRFNLGFGHRPSRKLGWVDQHQQTASKTGIGCELLVAASHGIIVGDTAHRDRHILGANAAKLLLGESCPEPSRDVFLQLAVRRRCRVGTSSVM